MEDSLQAISFWQSSFPGDHRFIVKIVAKPVSDYVRQSFYRYKPIYFRHPHYTI